MADGKIAELPTGEGKTLAAVFTAAHFAISGRPVHVLTFNDYLARRDAAWMGPAYRLLGLDVGAVQEGLDKPAKRAAYASDITYATAKEAGFDYLRDRLASEPDELVHRPFAVALVDEADSILVDEARIPLVISGSAATCGADVARLTDLVRSLERGPRLRNRRRERQRLPHGRRHPQDRVRFGVRQPLCREERAPPLGAPSIAPFMPGSFSRGTSITSSATAASRSSTSSPAGSWTSVTGPTACRLPSRPRKAFRRGAEGRILGSITPAALVPAVSGALRYDGHGRALGSRAQGILWAGVVVVPPHKPCVRRPPRHRFHS